MDAVLDGASTEATPAIRGYPSLELPPHGRRHQGQDRNTPQPVLVQGGGTLSGIVQVVGGASHTCARSSVGLVWCWGYNLSGQLGDGTFADRNYAALVNVNDVANAIDIVAGGYHTCALLTDHTVKCWGRNFNGQIGDGTQTNRSTATSVSGLGAGATMISATSLGSCALLDGGSMQCWGNGQNGQLGNNTTTVSQLTPAYVRDSGNISNLQSIATIASGGGYHNCAIASTGQAYCWGSNANGQLGDGTTTQRLLPVAIGATPSTQPSDIAAGDSHTCTRTSDGNYYCWGYNSQGQIGDGTRIQRPSPTYNNIPQWISPAMRIAAAHISACAISSAFGNVYCWGSNNAGQLGDGTYIGHITPALVSNISNVVSLVGLGAESTASYCALRGDGTVWCWGDNQYGNIGDGTTTARNVPTQVAWIGGFVIAIAGSCALGADGTVSCWGRNDYGQVGDNTTINRTTATQVSGLTGVIGISRGLYHACAVKVDGRAYCWGRNNKGQLGLGNLDEKHVPTLVPGLSSVTTISAGTWHTCALSNPGTGGFGSTPAQCWGDNTAGAIGDGTTNQSSLPVLVSLPNLVTISAGNYYTCATRVTGDGLCWGANWFGQVGDGTFTSPRPSPTPINVLHNIVNLTAGSWGADTGASYALQADGSLWAWGYNGNGELGDGTQTNQSQPVPVLMPYNTP